GRTDGQVALVRNYFRAQGMFGIPRKGDGIEYTTELALDLGTGRPSVAGPKRPQDRIEIDQLKEKFTALLREPAPTGYGKTNIERKKAAVACVAQLGATSTVTGGGDQSVRPVPDPKNRKNTSEFSESEMV